MNQDFLIVTVLYLTLGLGIVAAGYIGLKFLNYIIDHNGKVSWSDKEVSELQSQIYKLERKTEKLSDACQVKESD